MGTGKTTKAIEHLKQYLASKHSQNIEVYVPRHDLADEWEQSLEGINARVVHVYPRTGGKWDESSRSYTHPIMCHRADYVRDLVIPPKFWLTIPEMVKRSPQSLYFNMGNLTLGLAMSGFDDFAISMPRKRIN
jgi:hypothetical protein